MDLYIFRLSDRSGAFAGVILIVTTDPVALWRKVTTDQTPEHIPHMVAFGENAALEAELEALDAWGAGR
jgi:hypothetical protein